MDYAKSLTEMNAITICLSHSWGGLEQTAAYDVQALVSKGLRMKLVALQGSPIHEVLKKNSGVEVIPLQYRPRDHFDLKLRDDFKKWILGDRVNLVHVHQPTLLSSIVPWLYAYKKVPLFVSRHIMSDHSKKTPYHYWLYRRVDSIIAMSESLKENVLQYHPVERKKIEVIRLGLDFDRFDPEKVDAKKQRAEWGADDSTIVLGLVGRIDPAKGQSTFLKAAAGLIKKTPKGTKLKFVIVGEETLGSTVGHLNDLKKLVEIFHLEDHVIFTGFKENIPECMQAFDVFVMPSRQEAFGLVAIEAMSMECPVIISSGGSAQEISGNGAFGLLVRPDDAFDLQNKMLNLILNEEGRRKMGKLAREHVKKLYDRDARMQKTLALYERGFSLRSTFRF